MIGIVKKYTKWLHTGWPAGTVEKLPEAREDGTTNVPGVYIVGDLTGIPLLKFSADTGARAVKSIAADPEFNKVRARKDAAVYDLAILGAGVSGAAAAMEAKKAGLNFVIYEASQTYSTIKNFPKGKPIFTYPTDMVPAGDLQFHHQVKEPLVEDLDQQLAAAGVSPEIARIDRVQRKGGILHLHHGDGKTVTKALRVIIGIGRSGNYRKLGAPGEELDKVYNRLHDPKEFVGKNVMVVGGGDSAMEAAIALTLAGAHTTLSYRKPDFSRPKPENVEQLNQLQNDPMANVGVSQPTSSRVTTGLTAQMLSGSRPAGSLRIEMASQIQEITADSVTLKTADGESSPLPNDVVFPMIGREPPLDFFRRSGIRINGEWSKVSVATLLLSIAIFTVIYQWKKGGTWLPINEWFASNQYFPFAMTGWWESQFADKTSVLGTLHLAVGQPGFWYSLAYTLAIGFFGYRRIKRRRTPYVRKQTISLFMVQVIPLFLLPYLILPYMGYNGCFDAGYGKIFADEFFPAVTYGYGREYWRAFGFILAWPLFFWNVFTSAPLTGWLIVSLVQTFVILPLVIRRWGKGVYCGWICSCGALAETLGDTHRHKMPHGPKWNRLNMIGQFFLLLSFIMLAGRLVSWVYPTETQINVQVVKGGILGDGDALIIRGQRFTNIEVQANDADYRLANAINSHFYNDQTKVLYAGQLKTGGIELRALDSKHIGIETEGNATAITGIESTASPGELKFGAFFHSIYQGILKGVPGFNYVWFVDLLFAGIIGVGLYFHFSGRVWCRFACPLAALMHIYARFSKFRIFPEKKKCISCNVCTSVCHQGIDIMNFANKGLPMEDPECVRCSACVQSCPTGVLQFGRYGQGEEIIYDQTPASLVQMAERLNRDKAA